MATGLEDEFGDIIQKARQGKSLTLPNLAKATGIFLENLRRAENEGFLPADEDISKIASALDLHGPSLVDIARGAWVPAPPASNPDHEVICIETFMGAYPVKCYLLKCIKSGSSAIVDTGGNPDAVINATKEHGLTPSMILLTHNHSDHAGGIQKLEQAFNCPIWCDKNEPIPEGCKNILTVQDGDIITLGQLQIRCLSTPGHTPGGISYHVGKAVLSGDVIFAGSMGRANVSFPNLFKAVTQKVLTLADDTALYPGHGPSTTVGEEKLHNPFFCGKV